MKFCYQSPWFYSARADSLFFSFCLHLQQKQADRQALDYLGKSMCASHLSCWFPQSLAWFTSELRALPFRLLKDPWTFGTLSLSFLIHCSGRKVDDRATSHSQTSLETDTTLVTKFVAKFVFKALVSQASKWLGGARELAQPLRA